MKKPANLKLKNQVENKRTKSIPLDYETRKQKYQELKSLRQELKQRKAVKEEQFKKDRKRINENKKRKELNELKSGKFQVIKNTGKIKKWKKKARQLLQRVPPEIFYQNAGNN